MSEDDLLALLGPHIDRAEALRTIAEVAQKRGLRPPFAREGALQILEALALEPGIIATVACFAKARLLLSTPRPGPEKR